MSYEFSRLTGALGVLAAGRKRITGRRRVILRIAGPPFSLCGKAVNGAKSRHKGRPIRDRCMGRIFQGNDGACKRSCSRRFPFARDGVTGAWESLDAVQGGRAARTSPCGTRRRRWLGRGRFAAEAEAEHHAREGECLPLGGVMQAEVADFDETLG